MRLPLAVAGHPKAAVGASATLLNHRAVGRPQKIASKLSQGVAVGPAFFTM